MKTISYFSSIVKIIETPKQSFNVKRTSQITFQAVVPYKRNNILIHLNIWGNLSSKVKSFYKRGDYVLIEGYISFRKKKKPSITYKNFQKLNMTVLRIYPIILNSNKNI